MTVKVGSNSLSPDMLPLTGKNAASAHSSATKSHIDTTDLSRVERDLTVMVSHEEPW